MLHRIFPIYIFTYFILLGDLNASTDIRYKTVIGQCPARSAGGIALKIVKEFEKNKSLFDVKKKIIEDALSSKYFISDYKVRYDPYNNFLDLEFDCPAPLMRVLVYRGKDKNDLFDAILVSSGKLYDPTYEELLRDEKKLTKTLPTMAIPVAYINKESQKEIATLYKNFGATLQRVTSEVILNDIGELTIVLSVRGNPSSIFMGDSEWDEKLEKLKKLVKYMEEKDRVPSVVNMTNSKKVVVKF